jgi:hypothetical protein
LQLSSNEDKLACKRAFIAATSSEQLAHVVCASCARSLRVIQDDVRTLRLADVPNPNRLHPKRTHPQHTIYNGMLLEPAGVIDRPDGHHVQLCRGCRESLESKCEKELPPALSLANNMWIGRVPLEVSVLTLPEQLLIAHVYPRAFVFKLFPRDRRARYNPDSLQSGLRGIVTSFDLSLSHVTDMLKGNLMPRPPSILSSLISITYVARGPPKPEWLKYTFRVRRQVVIRALHKLRLINPRYYDNVALDAEVLDALPEDAVPPEILSVMRHETDASIVEQESESSLPQEDENEGASTFSLIDARTHSFGGRWPS